MTVYNKKPYYINVYKILIELGSVFVTMTMMSTTCKFTFDSECTYLSLSGALRNTELVTDVTLLYYGCNVLLFRVCLGFPNYLVPLK